MDHWTKVKRSTVPLYKCTLCGKQFAIHSMGKGHLKTNGERGVLAVKEVPNRVFVNPGTSTPYRLGSKEEGIEKERREAQMKWRAQAKNLFASFPLVEENKINSKDEVIDIFPGETSDETLMIKSLMDKENRRINCEIMEETCLNSYF